MRQFPSSHSTRWALPRPAASQPIRGLPARPDAKHVALTFGMILLACSLTQAEPIALRPLEYIQASGSALDVDMQAIPCVSDWNGDGRKDLIVGYRYADKIALFLNEGTDSQPTFTNFVHLQTGGTDIYHAGSSCGGPSPWVCDYDADGRRDLLVGTGGEGNVYFYRNTNTDAAPRLAPGVMLQANGTTLSVGYRATPYVHDWDEDGRPDLLCGNGGGLVYYYRNIGTAQSPAYGDSPLIQTAGTNASFGSRSAIRVVDWDGDGRKDLVASAANFAGWCRNVGSNPSPVLEPPTPLRAPVSGNGLLPINTGYRMRLELADWNNDGVMDLLIGQHDGRIAWFAGYHFGFDEIALADRGNCTLRWNSAGFLKYDVLAGSTPSTLTTLVATNLPSQGNRTCWTNLATVAQQYFRIQIAQ